MAAGSIANGLVFSMYLDVQCCGIMPKIGKVSELRSWRRWWKGIVILVEYFCFV